MGLLLAASVAGAAVPAFFSEQDLAFPRCVGVQLKNGADWSPETLDKVASLGFGVVRKGMYWTSVQKEKDGSFDFSAYDATQRHAEELGLTTVFTLFGSHAAYESVPKARGVVTEEGRQGWAAFAAAAASHFRGRRVVFEIWNEPNVSTFWGKHGTHNSKPFANEYSALVKAAVPAMKKADPNCYVLVGALSNYWEPSYQWTEFCLQNGILATGFDAYSVHPYGVKTPEEHAVGHARIRALLAKAGAPDFPMVNSERGYSVAKTETGEGWSGGNAERSRTYQAWHFARQAIIDQLSGCLFSVWYEWGGNESFGLWEADGTPRPAVDAMKTFATDLRGFRAMRRIESSLPADYAVECRNASGARKLAVWTTPGPGGSPDETWPHKAAVEFSTGPRAEVSLTGLPQVVTVPEGAEPMRLVALEEKPVAPPVEAKVPDGGTAVPLFGAPAKWTFIPNTGKGSIVNGTDGDLLLTTLTYDFSASKSKSTPYVMATCPIRIEGAASLGFYVRTPIAQGLTFRVTDATGQTLQFKHRAKGLGSWEAVRFPLDRRLEHWDGANDGRVHFPVQSFVVSVPKPGDTLQGQVEYAAAFSEGTATTPPAAAAPAPKTAPAAAGGSGKGEIRLFDAKTGELAYTGTLTGGAPVPGAAPTAPAPPAATPDAPAGAPAPEMTPLAVPTADIAAGARPLALFDGSAKWEFIPNTGKGTFSLAKDPNGAPIGVLTYDFSASHSKSTPYVIAQGAMEIAEGSGLSLQVRTAVPQRLTFRLSDSTGQVLQFKGKAAGNGQWSEVRIPLNKKLEHWDGANDGFVHFPIHHVSFSVPKPEGITAGVVEFANAVVQ